MGEMDYRQITVKELCERALVNKKTLYRYYDTMDFLLAGFRENMMANHLVRMDGLRIPEDLDRITRKFFAFAQERGEVFEPITCAEPHGALQRQMTDRAMARHDGEMTADPERSLLTAFVTEATLAIYRQWAADGKSLPADRVADTAAKHVCRGALSATSRGYSPEPPEPLFSAKIIPPRSEKPCLFYQFRA